MKIAVFFELIVLNGHSSCKVRARPCDLCRSVRADSSDRRPDHPGDMIASSPARAARAAKQRRAAEEQRRAAAAAKAAPAMFILTFAESFRKVSEQLEKTLEVRAKFVVTWS